MVWHQQLAKHKRKGHSTKKCAQFQENRVQQGDVLKPSTQNTERSLYRATERERYIELLSLKKFCNHSLRGTSVQKSSETVQVNVPHINITCIYIYDAVGNWKTSD